MKIVIDKSFEKDTNAIDDKKVKMNIAECIKNVQEAQSIIHIKNLKKLKGIRNEYRIKIGVFRLGIRIEKDTVKFIRCLHRKEIYRFFPK
jgi:mRNA interferase RelE/StbE